MSQKTSLKPQLPRQVRIVEISEYEQAQSHKDKCQLLPAHVAAISQSQNFSPLKASQVGFVAKKKSESEIFSSLAKRAQGSDNEAAEHPQTSDFQAAKDLNTPTGKPTNEQTFEGSPETKTVDGAPDQIPRKKFRKISMSTHQESVLPQNIFDKAKILQQLTANDVEGPRYDDNGSLIPYSMVGKPDWYFKELIKENAKHRTTENSVCSNDTQLRNLNALQALSNQNHHNNNNNLSQTASLADTKLQKTQLFPVPWYKQADKTFISDVKFMRKKRIEAEKKQEEIEKNNIFNEKDLTEEQAMQKISEEEKRLNETRARSEKVNKGILSGLTVSDRIAMTKEQRVLQKHAQVEQNFDHLVFKQSIRMKRDPQESILLGGESHRKRIETLNAFHILQKDDPQEGLKGWQNSLRRQPEDIKHLSQTTNEHVYNNTTRPSLNSMWSPRNPEDYEKPQELEVIHRKRSALSQNVPKRNTLNGTFVSFAGKKYAQNAIDSRVNQTSYDMVKHLQEDHYAEQKSIEVFGSNKFEAEKNSIISYAGKEHLKKLLCEINAPQENSTNKNGKSARGQSRLNSERDANADRDEVMHKKVSKFRDHRSTSEIYPVAEYGTSKETGYGKDNNSNGAMFKQRTVKKYSLNDTYKSLRQDGSKSIGDTSLMQLNSEIMNALRDKSTDSVMRYEEDLIDAEQVIHSQWQDRHSLAKTGKFVFKKVQLIA